MALPREPQLYVKRLWNKEIFSQAIQLSAEAILKKHRANDSVSEFLAELGVKNYFLIGNLSPFRDGGEVLLESSGVGKKWGNEDLMVDLSQMTDPIEKSRWLQGAATAGTGAIYLMNLDVREASSLWEALTCAGINAPTSLFLLYCFEGGNAEHLMDTLVHNPNIRNLAKLRSDQIFTGYNYLTHTLRHNPNIRNLAVFWSNLELSDFLNFQGISLNNLHLEGFQMSKAVLQSFTKLQSGTVTNSLTLARCFPPQRRFPDADFLPVRDVHLVTLNPSELSSHNVTLSTFSTLLTWQLRHLTLAGFAVKKDLITFMEQLKYSSLYSLSLQHVSMQALFVENPTIIGAVVDALASSGIPFLDFGDFEVHSAIQAQLSRNQRSYILRHRQYEKEPAVALRLFVCGDAYAGKTTLLSTLSSLCSPTGFLNKTKALLKHQGSPQRTKGIQVHTIMRDEVRMSIWDMAGQTEFHAFHDHMFPDPSTSHGSPAMFMFVWSPVDSKDQRLGKVKREDEFEASFRYWLKFITSKTRQSNILRKLIVVLTRMDQAQFVQDALGSSIARLTATFSEIIQVVKVVEVDARSSSSVKPLASFIFQTAHDVLDGVEVYSICSQISKYLSSKRTQKSLVRKQPIIPWDAFNDMCSDKFGITDVEVLRAIAFSLNESGDIIYLCNLPFLVLDPNWFCHEVMGRLIHFPTQHTPKAIIPMQGYADQAFLEKLLKESCQSTTIEGSLLLALMEAMHLCCKIPGDVNGRVFIPATLNVEVRREMQWRGLKGDVGRSTHEYAYVGRRLECDEKDLTFLTPGLFSIIQIIFNKAFCESKPDAKLGKADVQLGINFISVCVQDMEIIVEWCLAKGDHVIDVMARAPDDEDVGHTLLYVEDEIIKTVISVCADPIGNQGVRLVEGVIRPDCLQHPVSSRVRENQCVLLSDLKQELKEQLEEGRRPKKLLHLWEGNDHLQPVTNHFTDLLGFEEYMKVLMSYKSSLEEASSMSFIAAGGPFMQNNVHLQRESTCLQAGEEIVRRSSLQEDVDLAPTSSHIAGRRVVGLDTSIATNQGKNQVKDVTEKEASHSHKWMTEMSPRIDTGEKDEQFVVAKTKSMVSAIYREVQSMKGKLDGLRESVDSMHEDIHAKLDGIHGSIIELRSHALPKIQRMVEQSLNFTVEKEAGRIPRLVFLTTNDTGVRRRMVTALFKEVRHVQIELFCEHREAPHPVDGQKGITVTTMGDTTLLKKALPHVNRILKVLTVVAKVGAHVVAGAGSAIPDLSKLIALATDSPGFLDNDGVFASILASPDEDFNGWQQWLVSVLEQNDGMTETNIASKFMLRRALYKDTSKVAWLCGRHYKEQCPLPLV